MRELNHVTVRVESPTIKAEDLAARSGITPDSAWPAGKTYGAFGATEKNNGFQLESKLGPTVNYEEHLREMIKRLAPNGQKLGQLGPDVEVKFNLTVHHKRAPALHFDRDTVRWLAVMNARLDIDTAVVADPPKPAAGGAGGAAGTGGAGGGTKPGL
jgi:hypothetical protein